MNRHDITIGTEIELNGRWMCIMDVRGNVAHAQDSDGEEYYIDLTNLIGVKLI